MATVSGLNFNLDGHEWMWAVDLQDDDENVSVLVTGGHAIRGTIAQHERFVDLYLRALDRMRSERQLAESETPVIIGAAEDWCPACDGWRSEHGPGVWDAHRQRVDIMLDTTRRARLAAAEPTDGDDASGLITSGRFVSDGGYNR